MRLVEALGDSLGRIRRGGDPKLELELTFLKLTRDYTEPDLDFLMISNRIEYLRDHRSWTHSFLVLPFLALALALLTKVFARRTPLTKLWLFAAVGLASHIVFDWATSFGTMFWTPASRHREQKS